MSDLLRKRLVFSGYVQGVGFRWRARHAAQAVGATGWVRNERDDRVLEALEQGRHIHVTDIEVHSLPLEPEERAFVTRDDRW